MSSEHSFLEQDENKYLKLSYIIWFRKSCLFIHIKSTEFPNINIFLKQKHN